MPSTSSTPFRRCVLIEVSAAAADAAPMDPASDPQNLHPHLTASVLTDTTRARNSHSRLSTAPAPAAAAAAISASLTVRDWSGAGTDARDEPSVAWLGVSIVTLVPGVNLT